MTTLDNVYVKKGDKSHTVVDVALKSTVLQFKQRVLDHTGLPVNQQRLLFAGKEMQDLRDLMSYDLQNGSTIHLVVVLIGGARAGLNQVNRKCVVMGYSDEENPTFELPCGHAMCQEGMLSFIQNTFSLNNKFQPIAGGPSKWELRCPGQAYVEDGKQAPLRRFVFGRAGGAPQLCLQEVPIKLGAKIAGLTIKELLIVQDRMTELYMSAKPKFKACPVCEEPVLNELNQLRVRCGNCPKSSPDFCFACCMPWKDSPNPKVYCGNKGCSQRILDLQKLIDQSTLTVKMRGRDDSTWSIRMCPGCGVQTTLGERCKHVDCTECGTSFCMACLVVKEAGADWPPSCGSYSNGCPVVPKQNAVAVMNARTRRING